MREDPLRRAQAITTPKVTTSSRKSMSKAGKDKSAGVFKAIEGYLMAHPDECNLIKLMLLF